MKRISIILFIFTSIKCSAQYYILGYDAQYYTQQLAELATRVGADGLMNNALGSIEDSKTSINNYLTVISGIQQTLYNSLTKASDMMAKGKSLAYIVSLSTDIFAYQQQLVHEAGKYPLLLPFAVQSETDLVTRATSLVQYIKNFVLANRTDAVMDSGKRDELYHYIMTELERIRAISYTAYQSVKTAAQIGMLKAYNPWQHFVNIDKQLFSQALQQVKRF